MLGDTDQILGSVPQNAQLITEQQNRNQDIGRQRAATASPSTGNMITITPKMAEGLQGVTGQDWSRMIGMKWEEAHFTALVSGLTRAQTMRDLQDERGKTQEEIEKMREEAAAQRTKDVQTEEDKREKDREDTRRDIAELRGSATRGENQPISAKLLRKFYGPNAIPKEVSDDENIPPLLAKTVMSQKDDVATFSKILNSLKNPLTGLPPDAVEQASKIFQQMKQQSTATPAPGAGGAPANPSDPLGLNNP